MPPIEQWKAQVGFAPGSTALYNSWRDGAKLQMQNLGITGKAEAGEKWKIVTEWTLKKRPFKSQAHYHGTLDYDKAVDGLLIDVAKKMKDTLKRRVDLNPSPSPRDLSRALGPRAVRIAYHNPDKTRGAEAAKSFWQSLTWRGRVLLVFTGMMEAPRMDSLIEMVCREVTVILKKGKQPRYLIGATARGQADLRDDGQRPLEVEDLIFLRTDDHVKVWWSAGDKDLLDLLVVVRRPDEADLGRDVTPPRCHIPMLHSSLFACADETTEVEEGDGEEKEEGWEGEARDEEMGDTRNESEVPRNEIQGASASLYFAEVGRRGRSRASAASASGRGRGG